jgi:hypothetical protein
MVSRSVRVPAPTASPRGGAPAAADPRGWFDALEALVAVPAGYREEQVGRIDALEMLRCGEQVLTDLVGAGLPCSGEPGAERFDRYDLFNLALYSASGVSVPERALSFALRWMTNPPEAWFKPMRWNFSIELTCGRDAGCGPEPWWSLARPYPEAFGGRTLDLRSEPAAGIAGPPGAEAAAATTREAATGDAVDLEAVGVPRLAVSAQLETRGGRQELRSPVLRRVVDEFMAAGYRWVRLPEEAQWRPADVLPHGVAPCISASLFLQEELRAAGFEAWTRRGWILGMLDLAHAWLEVRDSDGEIKIVDPVFAMLAAHAPAPHPEFAGACLGSRLNRLLPTQHYADQPLIRHECGGEAVTPRRKTVVRTDRARPRDAGPGVQS